MTPSGGSADRDFAVWATEQAALLREGRLDEVDARRLADELGRLGARQGEALRDDLGAMICKLLMWKYMPGARLPSWRADIQERRRAVAGLLAASPSLGRRLATSFVEAYGIGRRRAAAETGIELGLLPEVPPFTLAEARDEGFLPLEPGLEFYADLQRVDAYVADELL